MARKNPLVMILEFSRKHSVDMVESAISIMKSELRLRQPQRAKKAAKKTAPAADLLSEN